MSGDRRIRALWWAKPADAGFSGEKSQALIPCTMGLSPDILMCCVSHQETTVLFLIFLFPVFLRTQLTLQEAFPTHGNVAVMSITVLSDGVVSSG